MKKRISIILFILFTSIFVFAQSDDDLFGSDDDFFSDDGIEIIENVSAKSDLSKGTIFETGSIKIGGNFSTSIETSTVVYEDNDDSFGDRVKDTTLSPTLSAFLTVDARPTDILRMYTKFGFAYPFETTQNLYLQPNMQNPMLPADVKGSVSDWLKLKEMFTDFSVADRAFFRFGLHTVTWGTGFFFSPVSDIINASSINPEDTDVQVDGVLNLRTQVTFPGTQNCLWLYVIPSTDFKSSTTETYARDTALAAKGEIVLGGWEFGLGGYYKYENAPKAVLTASGSLKKCTIFGEAVYQYGANSQWQANPDWDDKDNIFRTTVGATYTFKDPQITLAGQYYFDSNKKDLDFGKTGLTYGHNFAAMANFGKIFGSTDLTASLLGIVNLRDDKMDDSVKQLYKMATQMATGTAQELPELSVILSGNLSYTPFKNCIVSCGPYVTIIGKDTAPVVAVKLGATLGGGKF